MWVTQFLTHPPPVPPRTCGRLLHGKDLEVQLANAKLEQQQHLSSQLLAKAELLQQANENLSQANEVRAWAFLGTVVLVWSQCTVH